MAEGFFRGTQESTEYERAFAVLGVPGDANSTQVKKAYELLIHTCHPDKYPGDAGAEREFIKITRARDLLLKKIGVVPESGDKIKSSDQKAREFILNNFSTQFITAISMRGYHPELMEEYVHAVFLRTYGISFEELSSEYKTMFRERFISELKTYLNDFLSEKKLKDLFIRRKDLLSEIVTTERDVRQCVRDLIERLSPQEQKIYLELMEDRISGVKRELSQEISESGNRNKSFFSTLFGRR